MRSSTPHHNPGNDSGTSFFNIFQSNVCTPRIVVVRGVPVSAPLIKLSSVTFLRNKKKILKNLSWTVHQNENWFILGSNGSGKTSLLEIVMGYHWASLGKVSVLGETYGKTDIPVLRRKIGYVAPMIQRFMKPKEAVFEVVASGLRATAGFYDNVTPAVIKAVYRALDQMELRSFENAPFGKLSSGEQLKAIIARALVHTPKLLILDEPFSALDMGSRLKIQKLIAKLGQHILKPSIMIVTHHFDDITPLYTHGLLLKEGKVVAQGRKERVLIAPNLSKTFGVPVKVQTLEGKYSVQEKL
jgi:iron complex transport system ATP-binding protein